MTLTGNLLIGQQAITGNREAIRAINPATGTVLEPAYLGGGSGSRNPLVMARLAALLPGTEVTTTDAAGVGSFHGTRDTTMKIDSR